MKIVSYQAHNVMRVRDIRFDLDGHNLFLVGGKNRQGKSSALNALLLALCGRSGMDYPEAVLKTGENEGWVKVQLSGSGDMHDSSGFTVEMLLKRKLTGQVVEEFRVLDSTGDEAPEPRTLLKRLCQLRAFDPLAFEKMDPKAKKDLLSKLLGLDFAAHDMKRAAVYAERTNVNRDKDTLKAQIEALPYHKEVPAEEVDTAKLMEELERRQAVNKNNAQARRNFTALERDIDSDTLKLQMLHDQIKKLQEQYEAKQKNLTAMRDKRDAQAKDLDGKLDLDETSVRQQIKDSQAINRKIRENQEWAKQCEKLAELVKKSELMTDAIEDLDAQKSEAIQNAKFPVKGMSFSEDGVALNGLPIEQASKAERVMASVDVGMALNPGLRLLVCQDGSDLDLDTLNTLEQKLVDNDFQMLVEIVTRTEQDEELCAVVIKDGQIDGAKDDSGSEKDGDQERERVQPDAGLCAAEGGARG